MTTITSEFTKEQLIEKLQHRIAVAAKYPDLEEAQLDAAIFKIALASLTAEPVVTFYRDGIEAAAAWVDQQREAYDSEHGRSDPDTGSFEFGNDAQREYSDTLTEIAEGIRNLHPNAGNSPAIPDGWIAVSERMPEEDGNYWGWWSGSKRQGPVWFIKSELQSNFQSSEITHWMPLLAAPKQEINN